MSSRKARPASARPADRSASKTPKASGGKKKSSGKRESEGAGDGGSSMPKSLLSAMTYLTVPGRKPVAASKLKGKLIALYFSAAWCPPCGRFTPILIDFYNSLKKSGKPFEVVVVSSDEDETKMWEYQEGSQMPWLTLPFKGDARQKCVELFGVQAIPALIVVNDRCEIITKKNGRKDVTSTSKAGTDAPKNPLEIFDMWKEKEKARTGGGGDDGDDGGRSSKKKGRGRSASPGRSRFMLKDAAKDADDDSVPWKQLRLEDPVNYRTTYGFSEDRARMMLPIHVAFRDGNIQLLKYLMARDTNPNVLDQHRRTPLHYAAMQGTNKGFIRAIKGDPLDDRRRQRKPEDIEKDLSSQLYESIQAMATVRDDEGNTPLHYACRYGHAEIAEFLLGRAPDVNEMRNRLSRTPYDEMTIMGHTHLVHPEYMEKLQPRSVRASLAATELNKDDSYQTPGTHASKLQRRCNKALVYAITADDTDGVRRILDTTPANPLAANRDGITIMDLAIRHGNMEIVKLLDNIANPKPLVNIDLIPSEASTRRYSYQ